MSGSLKPYSYFICRCGTGANPLQQCLKALSVVGDGKDILQHLALGIEDKAVLLVLRHIDSNANHKDTSNGRFVMLYPQILCLVTLFHINRLAVSN